MPKPGSRRAPRREDEGDDEVGMDGYIASGRPCPDQLLVPRFHLHHVPAESATTGQAQAPPPQSSCKHPPPVSPAHRVRPSPSLSHPATRSPLTRFAPDRTDSAHHLAGPFRPQTYVILCSSARAPLILV